MAHLSMYASNNDFNTHWRSLHSWHTWAWMPAIMMPQGVSGQTSRYLDLRQKRVQDRVWLK